MEPERKEIDLELVKSLMDETYCLICVNYTDNLNEHTDIIRQCLAEKSADPLHNHFDGWYMDSECEVVNEAVEELKKRLVGMGYKRWEAEKFFEENNDEIREEIYSRGESDSVEDMLKHTRDIPVRIEMLSNYDCINSHWFESQGGFSYEESYFGDMVDALRLNPKKVKQMLVSHGEKVCGRFPDRKNRNGKEYVSYEQFYEEHINSSSPANLLTYMATVNPMELYESGFNLSKLTIPKGNKCGLYSSTYGGGSIIEMELLHDITIDIERTEYPQYRFEIEANGKDYNYSIKQVYGLDRSAFGKPIRIETAGDNDRISA